MCETYVAAGLPPDRFWEITPRLYDTELRGALARQRVQRELVWFGAMLPHLKKPIELSDFVGGSVDKKPRIAAWIAAWDKVDAGLARAQSHRLRAANS